MQVSIRKMGHSHGVLIPKPILLENGLTDGAEPVLHKGVIEIRPIKIIRELVGPRMRSALQRNRTRPWCGPLWLMRAMRPCKGERLVENR